MIGILALQGAFLEHQQMLSTLQVPSKFIRILPDFDDSITGLILPGGESTTMIKLLHDTQLFEPIQTKIKQGLPVFGTCAGLILLAKTLVEDPRVGLRTLDCSVKRNAYGRQLASFEAQAIFQGNPIPLVFIRAPKITEVAVQVEVLMTYQNEIILVRQGNMVASTFHPELTDHDSIHRYFIEIVNQHNNK